MNIKDITKTKARFNSEDERHEDNEKALKTRAISLYNDGKEFDDICQQTYDRRPPLSTTNFIDTTKNVDLKKLFDESKNRYAIHCKQVAAILESVIMDEMKK